MYSMFASVSENVLPHILTFSNFSELLTFFQILPEIPNCIFLFRIGFYIKPQTQEMNKNATSTASISTILNGANFFSFLFIRFISLPKHQFIQPALVPVNNKYPNSNFLIPGRFH